MKKLLLSISFFVSTPLLIFVSIAEIAYISFIAHHPLLPFGLTSTEKGIAYAALPSATTQVYGEIGIEDSRVEKVASFFRKYGSILEKYSQEIVQASDKNNFDYRILAAIAMQESQGCQKIPAKSYNCWGYGINSKQTIRFSSYSEAITTVSNAIGKYYTGKGLTTPERMGPLWNPTDNNGWIEKVNYFLNQI